MRSGSSIDRYWTIRSAAKPLRSVKRFRIGRSWLTGPDDRYVEELLRIDRLLNTGPVGTNRQDDGTGPVFNKRVENGWCSTSPVGPFFYSPGYDRDDRPT
jgi:hypothetical protein